MHLRQAGFLYTACGKFTKTKEKVPNFKERQVSQYIYENKLDESFSQHDITYEVFKDLTERTASDIVLSN